MSNNPPPSERPAVNRLGWPVPPCEGCGSPPASANVDDVCPKCGAYMFICGIAVHHPLPQGSGVPHRPIYQQMAAPVWEQRPPSNVRTKKRQADNKSASDPACSKPRWHKWAIGLEAGNKWHLFRQVQGEWRQQSVVRGISKGRQARLMKAFAEGGGFLDKAVALKMEGHNYSAGDIDKRMAQIKPEITKLRATIRKSIDVQNGEADPLPFNGDEHGWRAEIEIGYAITEDAENVGGEKRLRFKKRSELTREESADR